jgi:N-methylhydantoinase A
VSFMISIDNGGTFTDICVVGEGSLFYGKTPTTPYDLAECFREVLKVAAVGALGDENISHLLASTELFRYSSTVGTNAVVEKKGPKLGVIFPLQKSVEDFITTKDEIEMWSTFVGDRVCQLNGAEDDATFESDVVTAVNGLLNKGANRLIVSLGTADEGIAEQRVKRVVLRKFPRHLLGAVPVLFSHELTSDHDDKRRTWTAMLNSFLHPEVERFFWNTEQILRQAKSKRPMLVFHNDGNSGRVAKTIALKTYSSGPRGGLEGLRALAQHYGWSSVIGMDVGGTTTDIGIVNDGAIGTRRYGDIAGVNISFPLAEVMSTGIGGSSVFSVSNGSLQIGPQSVGAIPGPACFGRGGQEATITDAYLSMGVFDGETFLGGRLALDVERARMAVEQKVAIPLGIEVDEALLAMQATFEAELAATIPQVPDMANSVLVAFGGAGPMSACAVATQAGIDTVMVPQLAAVFSAFGVAFSDIGYDYEAAVAPLEAALLDQRLMGLSKAAERDMFAEGFSLSDCTSEYAVQVSGDGESVETIPLDVGESRADAIDGHQSGLATLRVIRPILHPQLKPPGSGKSVAAVANEQRKLLVGINEWSDIDVYTLESLAVGSTGSGPAIVEGPYFTCRVLENWSFEIDNNENIKMQRLGRADQ